MIKALLFVVFGGFLTFSAIQSWRHRHAEKVSILEAAILKATGAEPLPLTWVDRILQKFQIVMASVFGPLLLILGIAMMVDQLGIAP